MDRYAVVLLVVGCQGNIITNGQATVILYMKTNFIDQKKALPLEVRVSLDPPKARPQKGLQRVINTAKEITHSAARSLPVALIDHNPS